MAYAPTKKPDDYVLATGETHSVKDFVKWVEQFSGKKIKIIHNKEYDRPTDVPYLKGNPAKAKKKLKWQAKIKGKELAKIMWDAFRNSFLLNSPSISATTYGFDYGYKVSKKRIKKSGFKIFNDLIIKMYENNWKKSISRKKKERRNN